MAKKSKGKPPRKGGVVGALFGLLFGLVILAAAGAGGAWFFLQDAYTRAGPATADGAPRVVTIEQGASSQAIAAKLEAEGAIGDAFMFRAVMRAIDYLGKPEAVGDEPVVLKAGEFALPSGASMKDIIEQISGGRSLQYAVIIPEGLTSAAIMTLLAEREWRAVGGAPYSIKLAGEPPPVPAEGVLLPGDYMVQRGDTQAEVVARMIRAQQALLEEAWPTRQGGLPFDTMEEAINLASIVEKETALPEERPEVAGVFVNRLRRNMRLQTDPTIIYGVCLRRPDSCIDGRLVDSEGRPRGIRASEIALDTGFNTYQIDGLPPTPISNPGAESIRAVLDPPATDSVFFVVDGECFEREAASGGAPNRCPHLFTPSLAEHNANVQRLRQAERAIRAGTANSGGG